MRRSSHQLVRKGVFMDQLHGFILKEMKAVAGETDHAKIEEAASRVAGELASATVSEVTAVKGAAPKP
jgi:hypothetical protein